MGRTLQPRDLERAVAGDLSAFARVESSPESAIRAARKELAALAVTAEAVSTVLGQLRAGTVSADRAQRWASFIRRGYLPRPGSEGVRPIAIEFERGAEDEIADAISRLDELGDTIDGTIDEAEFSELLSALGTRGAAEQTAPT